MQKLILLSFCALSLNSFLLKAEEKKTTKIEALVYDHFLTSKEKPSNLVFTAEITPVGSFEGKSSALEGDCLVNFEKKILKTCTFKLDVSSITTENETRDEHMRDKYLKAKEGYTHIYLKLPEQTFSLDKNEEAEFSTEWTIKGKSKKDKIKVKNLKLTSTDQKKIITFDSQFLLDILDFDIEQPTQMLVVKMKTVISLRLSIYLEKEKGDSK